MSLLSNDTPTTHAYDFNATSVAANFVTPATDSAAAAAYATSKRENLIICVILGFISVFGTIGNGLVIYVFTRKNDKVTSTIFILALAWTDLFTCMIIVPYTVVSIQTDGHLHYDLACKAYQFLITFTVPLSPFIMVAIAVDRYFSICHPFMHAVTPRRARISIMCLCFFAFTLGTITALMYSVYADVLQEETVGRGEASWCPNITDESSLITTMDPQQTAFSPKTSFTPTYSNSQAFEIVVNLESFNTTSDTTYSSDGFHSSNCTRNITDLVWNNGFCDLSYKYFSFTTIDTFANIQASFYAISLLVVFTLYFFILRSVVRRRKWRRKQKSWSHSPMSAAPTAYVKQPNNQQDFNAKNPKNAEECQQENMELVSKNQNPVDCERDESGDSGHGSNGGNTTSTALSSSINNKSENGSGLKRQFSVGNGMSPPTSKVLSSAEKKNNRERKDFNFLANIRTAVMLFVVTVVFVVCFLPAWLMAAKLIPFKVIVFYMYFTYNSANPIIYAFMNQSFRKELKRVFQRGTNFLRSG